jgi:coenzyme PQQ biosynthesis protein PqqD
MMEILDIVPRKSELAVFRKIGEEYIVVPIASSVADVNSMFSLNETGAAIWDLIDGKRSVRDIVSEIEGEFETDRQQLESDVISFIREMTETKMVEM